MGRKCLNCNGTGVDNHDDCPCCDGMGFIHENPMHPALDIGRTVDVPITSDPMLAKGYGMKVLINNIKTFITEYEEGFHKDNECILNIQSACTSELSRMIQELRLANKK